MTERVVHVMKDAYDCYIGRADRFRHLPKSKWHNPFVIGKHGDRAEVLARYEAYIRERPDLMAALPELRGLTLACWCAEKGGVGVDDELVCHGQVLLRLLRETTPMLTLPQGQWFARNGPGTRWHITTGHGTGICGKVLHIDAKGMGQQAVPGDVCKRCARLAGKTSLPHIAEIGGTRA
jgi:hypothetical protein